MKITFLVDVEVGDGQEFEAGKTYDLNDASARRWLRRGKATEETKQPTKKVETAAVEPGESAEAMPKRAPFRTKAKK